MTAISELRNRLTVGKPLVRHNLTVFPLLDPTAPATTPYVPFGTAQRAGLVRITEISVAGSVPELAVETLSGTAVLLLDGEELIGAKQNRIVNLTILAAGKSTVKIPVSCVERGRWSSSSPEFAASPQTMYPRARAKKMMAVSASMRGSGRHFSDQSEVWADVDHRASELKVACVTGAMGDIYDHHRVSVEEYLRDVEWAEGQVGAAFAINGRTVGVEIFEGQNIAREYLPKVIRSYALDAIARGKEVAPREADVGEVAQLVASICGAESTSHRSLSLGTDFRIDSGDVAGGALVHNDSVVHLSGFLKSITDTKPYATNPGSVRGTAPVSRRGGDTSTGGRVRPPRNEGPHAERLPIEIISNHMLMRVSGGLALIDTGSPVSIGRGRTLTVQGQEWTPSAAMASVLDAVRQHLGVEVDWLIGYDILNAHRMLLDWSARAVHIGRARTRKIVHRFPIELAMGVPVITASHAGQDIRAVVDSGAALSYAPRSAVEGLPEAGDYQDFYPGVGAFTTQTWNTTVRLGNRDVAVRVGVLPEVLQFMFGMLLGPNGWIIGSEFFRDRAVLLDYRWNHFLDLTGDR